MSKVQIYTDGSARGNPDGPGGYGVVLHFTDNKGQLHEKTLSGGYVRTTNNRMELMAAIMGVLIPLTMMKLGRDPALGSSVMITAITDTGGFFIFLGLATLFLV